MHDLFLSVLRGGHNTESGTTDQPQNQRKRAKRRTDHEYSLLICLAREYNMMQIKYLVQEARHKTVVGAWVVRVVTQRRPEERVGLSAIPRPMR